MLGSRDQGEEKVFKSTTSESGGNAGWALETIPVREQHVNELLLLPDIHKDPFDRMLIAQARAEDMWLVTCDDHIRQYQVRIVW